MLHMIEKCKLTTLSGDLIPKIFESLLKIMVMV